MKSWRPSIAFVLLALAGASANSVPALLGQQRKWNDAASAYESAMLSLRRGRPLEALRLLEHGLLANPSDVRLLNAAGSVLMLLSRFEEAERYLSRALELNPSFLPARKNLGISLWMRGQEDRSRKEFDLVLNAAPGDPAANLFLGLIAFNRNDPQNAIRHLEPLPQSVLEGKPEALLVLARSYYACDRAEKASALLGRVPLIPGVPAQFAFAAAELAIRNGDDDLAVRLLGMKKGEAPDTPLLTFGLASALYAKGKFAEARGLLEVAIDKGQETAKLCNLLAWVCEKGGDTRCALNALKHAIKLEPHEEENYLDLSTMCIDHGSVGDLAGQVVDVGLANVPGSYRLRVQRGVIMATRGQFADAQTMFRDAMKLQPSDPLALLALGISQIQSGDISEALAALSQGMERFPRDHRFAYYFALANYKAYEKLGGSTSYLDASARALEHTIDLRPYFADVHYLLGKVQLARSRVPEAQREFETTLRLDPSHVEAKHRLARIYLRASRDEEAKKLLSEVQEARRKELQEETEVRILLVRK
jgi:tetratricopeptide (TPR) repeat protein